jgi:hypothetical protein
LAASNKAARVAVRKVAVSGVVSNSRHHSKTKAGIHSLPVAKRQRVVTPALLTTTFRSSQ